MASYIRELAFLDLTDIDEAERNHLQQVLYAVSPNLELPWEVESDEQCSNQVFEPPPFAMAPIAHPTLRGVFLSQPLYTTAPAAVAVGLVPSVAAAEQHPNEPPVSIGPQIDSFECNPGSVVASASPPVEAQVQSHGSGPADGGFLPSTPPMPMLPVRPSTVSSVPPSTQPVITTMYQMMGHGGMPLSNVYVGNMTANVNVHSFVGPPPLPPYPHLSQGVYSPGEMSVGHESSSTPSSNRNGLGQRRLRNSKPGVKRVEGQFTPRTPGVGHGHEVLSPTVVETPTGPPPLPQNYMIPVPSMHPPHPFHQPYYPSPTQPHGAHLSQHPSAQHSAGVPLFVPLLHAPMYNTYHHQTTAGPLVYSASPNMVPAPIVTSEHSSGMPYHINDGPSERMMPEGRETDVTVHEQQILYENEDPLLLKESVVTEEKIPNFIHHESVPDTCALAGTVVNNSNIVQSTQITNDDYNDEKQVVHEAPQPEVVRGSDNQNEVSSDQVPTVNEDRSNDLIDVSSEVKNASYEIAEEKEEIVADSSLNMVKVVTIEEPPPDIQQESVISESAPKQTVDVASSLPSSVPKAEISNSLPFPRPSILNDTSVSPVTPSPREKTWASLFNKNSRNSTSNDGPMILATGMNVNSNASKPLAAVRPFQNAVTVSGSSHVFRKPSDSGAIAATSKPFLQLGPSELPAPSPADDPHLYRLGELLSKYQLDHRAISLQPRGLTNRSNWCYINSTLQALLACPPFYNLMKALSLPTRRSGKSSTPVIESMVEFVNEFAPLAPSSRVNRREKAQRKDDTIEVQVGMPFEPSYIYKMLSSIQSDTFKVEGRQEDAEEFFSCLLNALNDEMLEVIKLVKDTSAEANISNGDVPNGDGAFQGCDEDDTEWKVMGKKNKGSITRRAEFERTPVSDIFRGQLRSRVQRAGDYSDNVQPFFTLQLDIDKAQSVKEALDLLVGRDQLEGVTCSRTNQEVEAWQQVTLEELPLVLVLHLKWFNYKLDGCSKIVKTVEFPIDLKFDGKLMSSYNKYNLKQKQYKLFAVVYHDGKEATKGHYITDVYHVGYGGWVRYDDSSVKAIQETQMLHPRGSRVPYLLYYRRYDTIGSGTAAPDKSR